jgi:hypothetical protein
MSFFSNNHLWISIITLSLMGCSTSKEKAVEKTTPKQEVKEKKTEKIVVVKKVKKVDKVEIKVTTKTKKLIACTSENLGVCSSPGYAFMKKEEVFKINNKNYKKSCNEGIAMGCRNLGVWYEKREEEYQVLITKLKNNCAQMTKVDCAWYKEITSIKLDRKATALKYYQQGCDLGDKKACEGDKRIKSWPKDDGPIKYKKNN